MFSEGSQIFCGILASRTRIDAGTKNKKLKIVLAKSICFQKGFQNYKSSYEKNTSLDGTFWHVRCGAGGFL